jgi:hypothetical protein
MKYMILTYLDEKAWLAMSAEDQKREMESCYPNVKPFMDAGKILGGAPLHPTSTATTVSFKDGKRILTDGPFAETREQLGGYTVLEANDLDEAIAIATAFVKTSGTSMARLEVRPIVDLSKVSDAFKDMKSSA